MKRTIIVVAGLATLAAVWFGSQLLAQQPQPVTQPAPTSTRVAVINIGTVFLKYNKAVIYKGETETILKPYRDEAEKLKKLALEWEAALKNPALKDEDRKKGERTIIDIKRRLEDLDREARTKVGKRNEEQIIVLYRDINDAVQKYAQTNGFHMVIGYGEPPQEADLYSFMNISRKMQAMDGGAIICMHYAGGMDISNDIVATLNRGVAAPPGGSPVVAPTQPGQK